MSKEFDKAVKRAQMERRGTEARPGYIKFKRPNMVLPKFIEIIEVNKDFLPDDDQDMKRELSRRINEAAERAFERVRRAVHDRYGEDFNMAFTEFSGQSFMGRRVMREKFVGQDTSVEIEPPLDNEAPAHMRMHFTDDVLRQAANGLLTQEQVDAIVSSPGFEDLTAQEKNLRREAVRATLFAILKAHGTFVQTKSSAEYQPKGNTGEWEKVTTRDLNMSINGTARVVKRGE